MTGLAIGVRFAAAAWDILDALSRFGTRGVLVLLATFFGYRAYRWYRRRRLIHQLRMDCISVSDLNRMVIEGDAPLILDVRTDLARQRDGAIPGSVSVNPDDRIVFARRVARAGVRRVLLVS